MPLGKEWVEVKIHGGTQVPIRTLELVPTLWNASQVLHALGPLHSVARRVQEGSLETIADLIEPHACMPRDKLLDAIWSAPIDEELIKQLLRYLSFLAGVDPDDPPKQTEVDGDPDYGAFYQKLFEIGTGWLGWSVNDTWGSSPLEIMAAFKGRQDMLKAIFGDGSKGKGGTPKTPEELNLKTHAVMAGLAKQTVRRKKK